VNSFAAVQLQLVMLIHDWEQRKHPIEKASPVEVLKFLMDSNDHSPKDLWHIIDKTALSRILSDNEGRRAISKEQAKKLGAFYHVSPPFSFNLSGQAVYTLILHNTLA
jgi:HTH-type transcriptional regulator/antitoxin HigA